MSKKQQIEQAPASSELADSAPALSLAASKAAELRQLQEAADQAAFEYLAGRFSADQVVLFDAVGWEGEELTRQLGRCKSVLAHQKQAGSAAEREAARARLTAIERSAAARREEIAAAMEALKQQLASIDKELNQATRKVTEHSQAVEALRRLAPPWARHTADLGRGQIAQGNGSRQLAATEAALAEIEGVFAIDSLSPIGGDKKHRDRARRLHAQAIAHQDGGPKLLAADGQAINETAWREYVAALRRDRPEIVATIDRLRGEITAAKTAAEVVLEVYVPK